MKYLIVLCLLLGGCQKNDVINLGGTHGTYNKELNVDFESNADTVNFRGDPVLRFYGQTDDVSMEYIEVYQDENKDWFVNIGEDVNLSKVTINHKHGRIYFYTDNYSYLIQNEREVGINYK